MLIQKVKALVRQGVLQSSVLADGDNKPHCGIDNDTQLEHAWIGNLGARRAPVAVSLVVNGSIRKRSINSQTRTQKDLSSAFQPHPYPACS
jgi:hypothetical protein